MGKHLMNLIVGASQAMVIWPGDNYVRPSKDGFRRDMSSLRKDAERVASDLKKTTLKHGKQIYNR